MLRTIGTMVSLLALSALSSPLSSNLLLRDEVAGIPDGFTLNGAAPPDTILGLRVVLVQSDPAGLAEKLYDISTPSSPNYRKFLSKEEAAAYVTPTAESFSAVTSWLRENNIVATPLTPAGDWLSVHIPVKQANSMFGADFSVFTHDASGERSIRTLSYSIPATLDAHLDFVFPATSFVPPPPVLSPSPSNNSSHDIQAEGVPCNRAVVPACLQSLYGIPTTPASTDSALLVTGYLDQFAQLSDLEEFLESFRMDISSETSFDLQTLDGGSNPQNGQGGLEASLDIQYTVGIASGVPVTFLSVGKVGGGVSQFADTANFLLNEESPPQTMTTSYGLDEQYVDPRMANNLCNAYGQLGARGVSIMFSSGDGGVAGSRSTSCSQFLPTFPSTCPFVTSVGSTQGINPETAASFSAGGFSNIFAQPDFQAGAVANYVRALGSTYAGLYNASGRAYPDVSTQGNTFIVLLNGKEVGASGTSASSPTFASIVALLNDELAAQGNRPLGFLNPLLYENPNAFTDITSGSNPGCGTNGFPAIAGWSPVTGLGTPIYSKLQSAAGL